jgi:hypothetical protein
MNDITKKHAEKFIFLNYTVKFTRYIFCYIKKTLILVYNSKTRI